MSTAAAEVIPIAAAAPDAPRLALGPRQAPDGFKVIDTRVLMRFPWDMEDESAAELYSRGVIEMLPARAIEPADLARDTPAARGDWLGRDFFMAFFDEAYRVLQPGGKMVVMALNARHSMSYLDPRSTRRFVGESFLCLIQAWRARELPDLRATCAFEDVNASPIVPIELTLLHQEAAARRLAESWNVIQEWQVVLRKAAAGGAK